MKTLPSQRQASCAAWIGVARADITPPPGIPVRNWGVAVRETADGVHRPLTLTCLAIQSGVDDEPLVLVAADLGWWRGPGDEEFVRGGVLEELGLAPARVLLCLSHTHSGPALARDEGSRPGGRLIERYLRRLRSSVVDTARRAIRDAAPAVLDWRYGRCDLACHRDLPDPKGGRLLVGFHPGAPADDTLLVGRVTSTAGAPKATLVNYACHPTTLAWQSRLISPDFVGAMREVVETRVTGPCLFLQGASGDLAPAEQYVGEATVADAHGRRLGHAVLSTLEGMLAPASQLVFAGTVESGAPLGTWARTGAVPPSDLSAERVEIDLPLKPPPVGPAPGSGGRGVPEHVMEERLRRFQGLRQRVGSAGTSVLGLTFWRLGDALLVGVPGEAYSELQTELRRHFGPRPVAVVNLANGYSGYLPPRRLYGQDAYAVTVSVFAAGGLERVVEEAVAGGERLLALGGGGKRLPVSGQET